MYMHMRIIIPIAAFFVNFIADSYTFDGLIIVLLPPGCQHRKVIKILLFPERLNAVKRIGDIDFGIIIVDINKDVLIIAHAKLLHVG